MRITDLGEFGLIDLVQQWTKSACPDPDRLNPDCPNPDCPNPDCPNPDCPNPDCPNPDRGTIATPTYRLVTPNGDDAAAVAFAGPVVELYTTDTMVDGIHFTASTTPWRDLGWKALASNISDIAAMGGDPSVALITLGLPPETLVDDVRALYQGMTDICRQFGACIVGGDMVRSPVAFVTVALTGIAAGTPMVRTAAQLGHLIGVTGPVGGSAGGLRQLLEGTAASAAEPSPLVTQHRRPHPHVSAGRTLVAAGVASAMDVSDGLADDLGKLCYASGVAATIFAHQTPVLPSLRAAFPDDWLALALYGGEDYVILFTAPQDIMDVAMAALPEGAAVVGKITEGEPGAVTILDESGVQIPAAGGGWDHFAD